MHRLVGLIQQVCTGFEEHRPKIYSMAQAMKKLVLHMQDNESVSDYICDFKALRATTETFGDSSAMADRRDMGG